MDIFLVRVCELADGTLYIERKPSATTADFYVAISHVWGDPSTIQSVQVNGVGSVELSPGKKDILPILRREDVCGTGWFWMDLFCIDQRPESPISIADQLTAIPQIYKSSQMVKILIESPVCQTWAEKAGKIANQGVLDTAVFNEEELRHSRKCPNLLILDPWFERLWTRQEGLYAMKAKVVFLNLVPCARFTTSRGQGDRWVEEGKTSLRRNAVDTFIADKLAYHGVPTKGRNVSFQFYLDLVYKHQIDVRTYGGTVGPHENYSPFGEAWRSGRQTSKPRDYVLAVFPDIEGYRAPTNARRLSFRQLLSNAFQQLIRRAQKERFYFLPKVPGGLKDTADAAGSQPWIFEDPATVTEAFDSFMGVKASLLHTPFDGYQDGRSFSVAQPVEIEPASLTRKRLPEIVEAWERTADTVRHMIFAAPSGPCTGSNRLMRTSQDLLYRYLGHQFARSAVTEYYSREKLENLRPHGIVNLEKLELSDDMFERELKRFLVCLVCGTTLKSAGTILETVEVVLIKTGIPDNDKLLAVVNKRFVGVTGAELRLGLASNGFDDYQGLQVVVGEQEQSSCLVVGRTVVPKICAVRKEADKILQVGR